MPITQAQRNVCQGDTPGEPHRHTDTCTCGVYVCACRIRDLILIHPECPARGIVRHGNNARDLIQIPRYMLAILGINEKYVRSDLQREKLAIKADNDNEKRDKIYCVKNGTDFFVLCYCTNCC